MESIRLSKVKQNRQGKNVVYLNNIDNSTISITSPYMFAPFGLSVFDSSFGKKYSIELSFFMDKHDHQDFYNTLKNIDKLITETAIQNSEEWFGTTTSPDKVYEMYRPLVKKGRKKKNSEECYSDSIRLSIKDVNTVNVFDGNSINKLIIEQLEPRSNVQANITISPIWFSKNSFGVNLNTDEIHIRSSRIKEFSFADSDTE